MLSDEIHQESGLVRQQFETKLVISSLCLLVLGIISPALGQEDRPRLLLNVDGPVGSVTCLTFSADSRQLLAAGTGKSVTRWVANPTSGFQRATPATPLNWEIARAERGAIYTMAQSPDGTLLAIGGYSAREATGDIILYDTSTQDLHRILPLSRSDTDTPQNAQGHRQPVICVAWSPDGTRLASISTDGEVRLWSAPDWSSRRLRPAATFSDKQAIGFVTSRLLAIPRAVDSQAGQWTLDLLDIENGSTSTVVAQSETTDLYHQGSINALISIPGTDRFISSDGGGNLFVFSTTGELFNLHVGGAENGGAVRSMAILPDGTLGVMRAIPAPQAFEILQIPEQRMTPFKRISRISLESTSALDSTACAVSRDGKWLAMTARNGDDVWVFPLTVRQPLKPEHRIRLFGSGAKVTNVAFSTTDYQIKVDTGETPQGVAFDFSDSRLFEPGNGTWQPHSGGQRRTLSTRMSGSQQILEVIPLGRSRPDCQILLETGIQGTYVCHCWLKGQSGREEFVAIGTNRSDIFVYQLTTNGQPCELKRYFRDHSSRVTSLSVSHDGKYLASSSWDQTVKIWSLIGLESEKFESTWGGQFQIRDGEVVLASALGAGIVTHRDMLPGDQIRSVTYAKNGLRATAKASDEILNVLRSRPVWETCLLEVERNGKPLAAPFIITPAWEPVLTLFISRMQEWALWTPRGVYDSSVNGDELFGWLINRGRNRKPSFFRAEQFRKELEKPDVIRRILNAGSLSEALTSVSEPATKPVATLANEMPTIRMLSPQMSHVVRIGEPLTVEAEIIFSAGSVPEDYIVEAFINHIDAGNAEPVIFNGRHLYRWRIIPTDPQNVILVRARRANEVSQVAHFADARVLVRADRPAEKKQERMQVHFLSITAQNYTKGAELRYPHKDGQDLLQFLKKGSGTFYELAKTKILKDPANAGMTKGEVKDGIDAFLKDLDSVSPQDLVIVFVAGHGQAYGSKYYFIPPDPEITRFTQGNIERLGVPWETIVQITDLPCRKLYLLDTCYSGNAAQAEKQQVRALKTRQAIVFAATSVGEAALDRHPERENALFTGFLLEGGEGKADGIVLSGLGREQVPGVVDGRVDLVELVSYVTDSVTKYFQFQRPTCTPIHLLDFADLPLVPAASP